MHQANFWLDEVLLLVHSAWELAYSALGARDQGLEARS
jgi:hypothetical protein